MNDFQPFVESYFVMTSRFNFQKSQNKPSPLTEGKEQGLLHPNQRFRRIDSASCLRNFQSIFLIFLSTSNWYFEFQKCFVRF